MSPTSYPAFLQKKRDSTPRCYLYRPSGYEPDELSRFFIEKAGLHSAMLFFCDLRAYYTLKSTPLLGLQRYNTPYYYTNICAKVCNIFFKFVNSGDEYHISISFSPSFLPLPLKNLSKNRTSTRFMEADTCAPKRWQSLKRQLTNLSPEEFARYLQKGQSATLIDVRTPEEYERGCLPGAINISYLTPDLWDRLEQLDPTGCYLVYCRTERRSLRVCTLLQNGGFREVYNLDGGLLAWEEKMGMVNDE
jgi:phage shock protein E